MALESLRTARIALDTTRGIADLLTDKQRERVRELAEGIGGLETELWSAESRQATAEPKKPRSRR